MSLKDIALSVGTAFLLVVVSFKIAELLRRDQRQPGNRNVPRLPILCRDRYTSFDSVDLFRMHRYSLYSC